VRAGSISRNTFTVTDAPWLHGSEFNFETSHRRTVVPFERSPHFGAILVSVHVNGKPAVLILHTGSNTTILSPEISGLNPAHLQHADPPRKGTGFVGDGRWDRQR
jgi:hypothetical protein